MQAVINSITANPALAFIGALIVIAAVVAPIALRVAGLSGTQIVALLKHTASVFVELVRAYRCQDGTKPPDINLK